jgi:Fe-S-cluster containining protein
MNALEVDLTRIAELAAARHDEFEVLLYQLQNDDDIDDAKLDRVVEEIATPIRRAIDCTKCANCCRSIDIFIVPEDIEILAQGTGHTIMEVMTQFVENPDGGDEMKLKSCPCRFLKGKLCSVYEHRPESCRSYPAFTPEFRWTLENTIQGASICPIIYNVLSELVERVDSLYPAISK